MIFAYADPPYIGQSRKHYGKHKDFAGEVDHHQLIDKLAEEYPDGWALSCASKDLPELLSYTPPRVRVLAWVKSIPHMLPGIRIQYGWEPVIFYGGRQGPHAKGSPMISDWILATPPGSQTAWGNRPNDANHVIGRKPIQFCFWLFDCFGIRGGDELVDLFPGSGAVSKALDSYRRQKRLFMD